MSTISIISHKRQIRNKRPSRPRNARVALSLLALIFIGTSAFAYILGPTAAHQIREYSVTAAVIQPAPPVTSPAQPATPASASDAESLEKTILSDANLAQAVQVISAAGKQHPAPAAEIAGQSLETLRGKLRVTTSSKTDSQTTASGPVGQVEIYITYSGRGDPRQACRFVDALAEQAARQNTERRRAAARAEHENAKKLTERARLELFKTNADYDAFLNQHFSSKLSSAPNSSAPGPLPPGDSLSQPTPGLHPPRTDWTEAPKSPTLNNPRWIELNNKLSGLMNRRAQLLEKMTPAHPEVQNVDLEIENLERLISSVPRELARPSRDSLPPISPMPPSPTDDLLAPGGEGRSNRRAATPAELHPRLAQVYRQKQKVLDLARQKYNRLADLERAAWQKLTNVQAAEVIPAVCPEISSQISPDLTSSQSARHLTASLIIGLCGAVGIGMFSAGVSPPSSFANATEVRNSLKVPVVGTMPAADLPGTDADRLGRPSTNRLALAASGLIFLIVAVAIIIIMFSP